MVDKVLQTDLADMCMNNIFIPMMSYRFCNLGLTSVNIGSIVYQTHFISL